MTTLDERLKNILATNPYLELEIHELHKSVVEAKQAVAANDSTAEDKLDRIEGALESEESTLAAAFKRFDHSGKNQLSAADMKIMSQYLGFPSSDKDIQALMTKIDSDRSGSVRFAEFRKYVGFMGGSSKLFETRRQMTKADASAGSDENLKMSLRETGIDDEAQAYWRLVVPQSEFQVIDTLINCQKSALSNIRRLAKSNHMNALPKVQQRVLKMGYKDEDLWMTLAWIRELAPIIVHLNLDKMLQFMESDTHYRNQFETATSGGLLKPAVREKWERDLFAGHYDNAQGKDRPKYGVQNVMNDFRGVVRCAQYGDSYVVLKDVRLRCTFSPEDSANLKAERLAVLDYYAHVLNEYSDAELKETLGVANSKDSAKLGDSDSVGKMKYKEAQIHGQVAFFEHVERLVAHQRHKAGGLGPRLQDVCRKFGWQFSWMDDEKQRMQAEDKKKMEGTTWEARLAKLEALGSTIEVPKGYCKVGCGRKVNPGQTRSGKPFTTCCKGCIMGFGHDANCGQIDASKCGPGLCKNGCGRPVAEGRDSKGRKLDTCCRACALGMGHDATCGQAKETPPDGACEKGCGRAVAPMKGGRRFKTCCRECAQGRGHGPECNPAPFVVSPPSNRNPPPAVRGSTEGFSQPPASQPPAQGIVVAPAGVELEGDDKRKEAAATKNACCTLL